MPGISDIGVATFSEIEPQAPNPAAMIVAASQQAIRHPPVMAALEDVAMPRVAVSPVRIRPDLSAPDHDIGLQVEPEP
jgi:hypothetical protein